MNNQNQTLLTVLILVLLAGAAYVFLNMPDHRSVSQKISDAADQLPKGVSKAARQLEDRTPGEKLGDAVKDTGDTLKPNAR